MQKGLGMELPSQRFRIRLRPQDSRIFHDLLSYTNLRTRSRAVRGALSFFHAVVIARNKGFRVVLRREASGEEQNLTIEGDNSLNNGAPLSERREDRDRTAGFFEIRMSPSDIEELLALARLLEKTNRSEILRQALHGYAEAVAAKRDGFVVVAVSPAGEMLQLPVPDAPKGPAGDRGFTDMEKQRTTRSGHRRGGLVGKLPQTLVTAMEELATKEGCSVDALIVEMLRTGIETRQKKLARLGKGREPSAHGTSEELFEWTEEKNGGQTNREPPVRGEHEGPISPSPEQTMLFSKSLNVDTDKTRALVQKGHDRPPHESVGDDPATRPDPGRSEGL